MTERLRTGFCRVQRTNTPFFIPEFIKNIKKNKYYRKPIYVNNNDLYIVSYPKSGNTWIRFIIGNLVHEDGVNFKNIEKRIADIYITPDSVLRAMPSPRILKNHEYFDPRYKRVIYIVRDPRDIVISYFHFAIRYSWVPDNYALSTFVEDFLQGNYDNGFGSWGENVGSWLGAREGNEDFLLIRYEDILKDTEETLHRISTFLGLNLSNERIQHVIHESSFERMSYLEKKQSKEWSTARNARSDKPFMRSGKSGAWKDFLSDIEIKNIEEKWGNTMIKLGYI